jgi:type III pantothenate kinase
MNLIVEIGNSRLKILVFENDQIILEHKIAINHNDFSIAFLQKFPIHKAILSGSGDMNHPIISNIKAQYPFIKKFEKKFIQSISYRYKTPETLGEDRLLNAYASSKLFPNQHNLIIDCGTCLTFSFIDAENVFWGGSISPGLQMRAKSLHDYTQNLPQVETDKDFFSSMGCDTEESIKSGLFVGLQAEIDYRIAYFLEKFNEINIILTGGDAHFFENRIKNKIFADSNLTFKGLNYILHEVE